MRLGHEVEKKRRRIYDGGAITSPVENVIYNVEVEKEVERALTAEDYAKAREYLNEKTKMFGREQQKKILTEFITTNWNMKRGASLFVCGPRLVFFSQKQKRKKKH